MALFGEQAPLLCLLIVSGPVSSSVASGFFTPQRGAVMVSREAELGPSTGTANQARGHAARRRAWQTLLSHPGAERVTRIPFPSW